MRKNSIKKLVCLAMSAAMLLGMTTTAFAADPTTNTVDVTYTESESYSWSIPTSAVTAGNSMTVSITQNKIESGSTLAITVSGANDSDSLHYLKDDTDADNKLEYEMKVGDTTLGTGGTVLKKDAASTGSATITTSVKDTATKAGTYTDTLTFTAEVKATQLISSVITKSNFSREQRMFAVAAPEGINMMVRAEVYSSKTAESPSDTKTYSTKYVSSGGMTQYFGPYYTQSDDSNFAELYGEYVRLYAYDGDGTYSGEYEITDGIIMFED